MAEALKGTQVQLVDMGEVGVGDNDVGQRLDVAQTMGYPTGRELGHYGCQKTGIGSPRGQLESTVVGRVEQARLGQSAPEVGQLAQADGPGFSLHPST